MNELAAAAAVMAMSVDDDGIDDLGLEDAPGGAASNDVAMAALEATAEDKENSGVLGWFILRSGASVDTGSVA